MSTGIRERVDKLLVEKGLACTRERARAMIMAGIVFKGEARVEKAGTYYIRETEFVIRGQASPYVSRGGDKLEGALKTLELNVEGLIAADIGASTGGFTDCLLQHGCKKVIAIDVGRGQLHWKLRNDPRVKLMEKINARYLNEASVDELVDLAVLDLSFISLAKVIPSVISIVEPGGSLLALIKPQFEAGREKVGKGGVVRDEQVRRDVVGKICEFVSGLGCLVIGVAESRVPGPKGNREFFIYFRKGRCGNEVSGENRKG